MIVSIGGFSTNGSRTALLSDNYISPLSDN